MLNKIKSKMKIILILLIGISNVKPQGINFQFVSKMKINETMKKRDNGKLETIKFLGNILDIGGKSLFKVVTVTSKTQASKIMHGQSQVVFLKTTSYSVAKTYNLSLPEELPFKLEKNTLFFNYKDESGKESVYTNKIGANLPKLLCVAPDDCW